MDFLSARESAMSKIVELRPDQVRTYADGLEDDAYRLPPGRSRQQLLAVAFTLRKQANLAEWLGASFVRAEVAEKSPTANAW